MRDVFIAGVGQMPVTKDHSARGRYLGASAVQAALADADVDPTTVGALFVGNMLSGILANQKQLGGLIADYSGLAGIEAVTIEAACASGGAAARMGYLAVAGGIHDVVVVCGVERMTHVERDTVTRALATAADWELEGVSGTMVSLQYIRMEEVPGIPRREEPFGVAIYAPLAEAPVDPDVVLVRGNARQIMLVAEAARGQGLARAFYEDLFTRASAAGHTCVGCEVNYDPPNPASGAFHEKLGFRQIGEARLENGKGVRYLMRPL